MWIYSVQAVNYGPMITQAFLRKQLKKKSLQIYIL